MPTLGRNGCGVWHSKAFEDCQVESKDNTEIVSQTLFVLHEQCKERETTVLLSTSERESR